MKLTCTHCGKQQPTRMKKQWLTTFMCKTCGLKTADIPHDDKDHFA